MPGTASPAPRVREKACRFSPLESTYNAGRYGSAPRSDRLAGRLRAVASRRSWAIFEARLRYSFGGGFHSRVMRARCGGKWALRHNKRMHATAHSTALINVAWGGA
jgi:hypothetical protein